MPMSTPVFRFQNEVYLKPLFPEKSRPRGVNLAPNTSYQPGSVLLPVSSSASDVQTVSFTNSPTGGTFTISGINPITGAAFTTAPITFAASGTGDTNIQTAINAAIAGYGSVTVTSLVITFGGIAANTPVPLMTANGASLTGSGSQPTASIAHTTTGATAGQYSFYNAAGTGTPTCLLIYGCITDGAGNITLGTQVGGSYVIGASLPSAQAYFGGSFATQDLVGLDTNAVTKLGRLSSGTVSNGVLEMIGY